MTTNPGGFDPAILLQATKALSEVLNNARRTAEARIAAAAAASAEAEKTTEPTPAKTETHTRTAPTVDGINRSGDAYATDLDILVPHKRTAPNIIEMLLAHAKDKNYTPQTTARIISNYIRSGRTDKSDVRTPATSPSTDRLRATITNLENTNATLTAINETLNTRNNELTANIKEARKILRK